ncbi:MAG: hypothetical protein M0P61_02630 [Ignavibacteriaceae bacterium]|nr:hypothetical protein [Ignavibacteriaceae bacterium]
MKIKSNKKRNYIVAPVVVLSFFLILSLATYLIENDLFLSINYFYIGFFTSLGMIVYSTLSKKRRLIGVRLSLIMISVAMFFGMGVFGRINGQVEGFFFYLFAGVYSGTVTHYLVAKILGPIILNRGWCGWGCWTMVVLDFLPYRKGRTKLPSKFGWIRYLHFAMSLTLVIILWFGFDYTILKEYWDVAGMYWFLIGNGIYYTVGISLTFILKDNRAFCKYVCPVTTFLKMSSSLSILRIEGNKNLCNECAACSKICPMDIDVISYTKLGKRVLSSECIMCLTCINVCTKGALKASVGLDF